MTGFKVSKKLHRLDAEVDALEEERRTLELRALNSEVPDAERRARYFAAGSLDLRRQLIGLDRRLHELRQRQRAAAFDYWTTFVAETRAKLADLKSPSPTSNWRRGIVLDVLTIFWILAGGGWLLFSLPGAAAGAIVSAIGGWFIVRQREPVRLASIREGEGILHSAEFELRRAQQEAAAPAAASFSATEAQAGVPDP